MTIRIKCCLKKYYPLIVSAKFYQAESFPVWFMMQWTLARKEKLSKWTQQTQYNNCILFVGGVSMCMCENPLRISAHVSNTTQTTFDAETERIMESDKNTFTITISS